jgi:hypothetical protein
MTDAGHRTITTVQRDDGSLTSEPTAIFQATQDSFLRQHTPTQEALDPNSQVKVTCPLRILNRVGGAAPQGCPVQAWAGILVCAGGNRAEGRAGCVCGSCGG